MKVSWGVVDGPTTYEVRFRHKRFQPPDPVFDARHKLRAITDEVVCEVTSPYWQAAGNAYCSVNDTFNRKRGEALALRRALERYGIPHTAWPCFFMALAQRHRGRQLSSAARIVLERARIALLRGDVEPADLELLVGDAKGRRP